MYFKQIIKIIILAVISYNISFATDFGLNISGTKNFSLNSKVGNYELIFNSSAPLEDIEGVVKPNVAWSSVSLDPSNIEKTTGKVGFKVKDLETGISKRDEHLHGESWLNSDKFPEIIFELKELKNVKNTAKDPPAGRSVVSADAVGTFTLHGVTKNISVPISITYIKESENSKKRAPGDFLFVTGKFDIKLKDFNVAGTKGIVGSKVGESITISFKLYYNS